MANLAALSTVTTAATALSGLIAVTPQSTVGYQPQPDPTFVGPINSLPPTLLFNYEGEQTSDLESDITDHYVEDNTAREDQIALRPEIIQTHGFIGELNDIPPKFLAPIRDIADKLTTIGAYTPSLSTTALLAYSEAFFLYQVAANAANAAVSAWSTVGNLISGSNGQSVIGSNGLTASSSQNKQQQYYQQFYGYWRSRTLFTVQTPWAVFQNMAIHRLRAIQDEQTNVITEFHVTFKMIRVASSSTSVAQASTSGRLQSQAASVTDLGTSSPVSSIGLTDGLATMGVA